MMSTVLPIISALIVITQCKSSREEEFSRITDYELVHIDLTLFQSTQIIQFTAFNRHYNIKLIPNHDMIASKIRHTSFDPIQSSQHSITSWSHSCHYFGTLLNTQSPSTIALSLCNNRGIRGRITAFNETILLKPSAYYLDFEHSVKNGHTFYDQVLIYKSSDFNTTNIGKASAIDGHPHRLRKQLTETIDTKRRLYSASTPAKTEVLVVNGPYRTLRYQEEHGSSWYTELAVDLMDVFNQVSATYLETDWGSSVGGVGSISIQMVELEIIFAFTGTYAVLEPDYYYSNCQTSYTECNINGRNWLSTFRQWIYFYKDSSMFDNAQLISDMEFSPQTSGWGNIGAVCRGSSSCSDIYEGWGLDYMAHTISHELGHNFGMNHDGQDGDGEDCDTDDGLMGYGNGEGFSSCSIRSLQTYYAEEAYLTCLSTEYRDLTSNYDDDGGDIDTPTTTTTIAPPVTTPTPRPTSRPTTSTNTGDNGDWECLGMRNIVNVDFDGYWENAGTSDGKTAYTLNGFYLYYFELYNWWLISSAIGSLTDLKGYCQDIDNIEDCSGQLMVFASTGWMDEDTAEFYDCSDTGSTDTDGDINLVCTYFDKLVISAMTEDRYGASYDGEWFPSGCHNEESYYMKDGDTSRYLCKSSDYNMWIMSDELCGRTLFAYSPQTTGGIMATQNRWNVLTEDGWVSDNDVLIAPDQAFTDEDLSCLESNPYNDNVCIYSNNTLWNGERTFVINTKSCRNGAAMYQYIEYDEDADKDEDSFGNSNDIKSIYHLHLHTELRYSDGNETIGEWMISKDQVSIDALALCDNENLLQCTQSVWVVDDYSLNEHSKFDGLLQKVIDRYMMISNGKCGSTKDDAKDVTINLDVLIYIAGGIVVFIGVIICSIWCYRQNKGIKYQRERLSDISTKNVNVESDDDFDDDFDEEVEVEVEATGLTHTIYQ